ncbi:MAG TPA: hypothetical protein EYH20_05645 [Leucothrix sp.]|nr:hypothetical protein [Leucothrix sp.]
MRFDVAAIQEDLRKAGLVLLAAVIIEHFIKGIGFNLVVAITGAIMWLGGVIKLEDKNGD